MSWPFYDTEMREPNHDPRLRQAIVHWQFDPKTWHEFLEFDESTRHKQDSKTVLVILVLAALVIGVLVFIASAEAVFGVGIFAGIILVTIILHFLIQRGRYQGMRSRVPSGAGDVYITPEGIWANGEWFDWGDATAWRLSTVTPVLSDTGVGLPPSALSYLEFNCRGRAPGRHGAKVDKKWRVPVPRGKEEEAREVVKYFGKPSGPRDEFGLPRG